MLWELCLCFHFCVCVVAFAFLFCSYRPPYFYAEGRVWLITNRCKALFKLTEVELVFVSLLTSYKTPF